MRKYCGFSVDTIFFIMSTLLSSPNINQLYTTVTRIKGCDTFNFAVWYLGQKKNQSMEVNLGAFIYFMLAGTYS